MFVSSCVFLILFIPRLVGAPTPPQDVNRHPPGFGWLPANYKLHNTLPPLPHIPSRNQHVLPLGHVQEPHTNPSGQPVNFIDANRPPHTNPSGQPVDVIDANRPPHTNPVHLVDENLGEEVCKLPKGTRYRVPPSHTVKELLPIARDYSGRVDRIAITPDDEVVLLPKGTIAQVIGNRIWLPAEVTGIRYIDKTDQDIVEKWCEQTYRQQEGIPLEPGWKYEPKDSYVRRCIDINLWNVGHRFEPVAVGKRYYTRRI